MSRDGGQTFGKALRPMPDRSGLANRNRRLALSPPAASRRTPWPWERAGLRTVRRFERLGGHPGRTLKNLRPPSTVIPQSNRAAGRISSTAVSTASTASASTPMALDDPRPNNGTKQCIGFATVRSGSIRPPFAGAEGDAWTDDRSRRLAGARRRCLGCVPVAAVRLPTHSSLTRDRRTGRK